MIDCLQRIGTTHPVAQGTAKDSTLHSRAIIRGWGGVSLTVSDNVREWLNLCHLVRGTQNIPIYPARLKNPTSEGTDKWSACAGGCFRIIMPFRLLMSL